MQLLKLDSTICLTARERDLAALVVKGWSNKQVARELGITEGTMKAHLHNIFQKLGVPNRTALTMLVHRRQTLFQEPPRSLGQRMIEAGRLLRSVHPPCLKRLRQVAS
jgi:DNA-binding CsgD family transcriptional regulator